MPYFIKVIQILLVSLYLTHLMACGFYYIGAQEYYHSNSTEPLTWLTDAQVPLQSCNPWSLAAAAASCALGPVSPLLVSARFRMRRLQLCLSTQVVLAGPDGILAWHTVSGPYVAALYWTFTTITTVGYGDLSPISTAERIYAIVRQPRVSNAASLHLWRDLSARLPLCATLTRSIVRSWSVVQFCMVFGTGLFGYIMGTVTALLASAATKQDAYSLKLIQLQNFMTSRRLPHDLQVRAQHLRSRCFSSPYAFALVAELALPRYPCAPWLQVRIRRYFRFYWERNLQNDESENELVAALSSSLRQETLRFLSSATVSQLPIFQVCEDVVYQDQLVRLLPTFSYSGTGLFTHMATRATS